MHLPASGCTYYIEAYRLYFPLAASGYQTVYAVSYTHLARKDNKGRNLKTGEYQRPDGRYEYRYKDEITGKRNSVYACLLYTSIHNAGQSRRYSSVSSL